MSVLKGKKSESKPIVLANASVARWKDLDGLSIMDVDTKLDLVDIGIGVNPKNDIVNLVLETSKEKIAFPLSRGIDPEELKDNDFFFNCMFYVRNKMQENDEEGFPTGPEYISFGKPSGITLEVTSLVNPEPVEKNK